MYHINVIEAPPQAFDFLAFPNQSPENASYFQNQFKSFNSAILETGSRFIEGAKTLYDKINDSHAIRVAKAAIRYTKGIFKDNVIIQIDDIENMRSATPIMQNYIMAQPDLRDLYYKQLVHGYKESYVDIEPELTKDNHHYYRKAMDGVIVEVDNKNGYSWVAKNYHNNNLEGQFDLSFQEKHSIMLTWDKIKCLLAEDRDPTDLFGL